MNTVLSKTILLLVFVTSLLTLSNAQGNQYTISGYVRDDSTSEAVAGASISVLDIPGKGTMTDENGFYKLTLHEGTYTLQIQNFGYTTTEEKIVLNKDIKKDFKISVEVLAVEEVFITVEKKNDNITQAQMGVEKLDIQTANKVPVLLGERDIVKTMQLIPGVKSAGEGNAGFYVRGGSADQNLVLMDGAVIYNASHMFGFFSVFNSDIVQEATIYKGNMPAEFGGRLSSVLDIKLREGSNQKFGVTGGIGLISSRLAIEGPIVKNKGAFIVSGRRSYADLFLKLSPNESIRNTQLNFYDLNVKANYEINEKNKIYLSAYTGNDILGLKDLFTLNWTNRAASLRWNHIFNKKLTSNTSLVATQYNYQVKIGFNDINLKLTTHIRDYGVKQDFNYFIGPKSTIKFGVHSIYHTVLPGQVSGADSQVEDTKLNNRNAWENAAYILHDLKLSEKINFNYGLRVSAFSVLGPGQFFMLDNAGNVTDTTTASKGEFLKTYVNPEPRFAVSYVFNPRTSVKASYTRNVQNLHLLSNSTSGSPNDLWIPSTLYIQPEKADQVALGLFKNFKENTYQFSAEVYYKDMKSQIDYKKNAQLAFNESVETQLLLGKGRAYGIELFLKKKFGKLNGWVGYTLSKTERQFSLINDGKWYPAIQDRRHDISVVGIYEASKKWTFSAAWVYYTGSAVTFPAGKYKVAGKIVSYYTERNGDRMPAYHRFDIGATLIAKKTEKFESSWTFSIYNLYARPNAYTITFRTDPDDDTKTQAVRTTLFQFVPSFTYNFKF